MINNLSILATLVLIAFVIVRAIALDKTLPWFGTGTGTGTGTKATDKRRR